MGVPTLSHIIIGLVAIAAIFVVAFVTHSIESSMAKRKAKA